MILLTPARQGYIQRYEQIRFDIDMKSHSKVVATGKECRPQNLTGSPLKIANNVTISISLLGECHSATHYPKRLKQVLNFDVIS